MKQQLQNPDNLKGAMWNYAEKHDPITNEHIFGSLNSSDWWKNADAALTEDLNKLGNNKPKGSHYVCPIIGFDDSTLCDNIGRLMVQPFLATVGVVRVVPAENILSEAYVLPTIEKVGDEFPNNVESADYFVVIPERAKWMGIGMQLIDEYEEET